MLVLLTLLTAQADPPTRVVEAFDSEGTSIQDLATSDDGSLVAAALSDGAFFLDTQTWQTGRWTGCNVAGIGLQRIAASDHVAWIGCSNGQVRRVNVDGATPVLDSTGDVTLEVQTIEGVHWDLGANRLYVIAESSVTNTPEIHAIGDDGTTNPTGFPVTVLANGYQDSVTSNGVMYIHHGSDDITTYTLGTSTATSSTTQFTPYNLNDIAPSIRGTAIGADTNGVIVEYSGTYSILLASIGDSADVVGVSDWGDDEWLMVGRGADIEVYELNGGSVVDASGPDTSFDAGVTLSDIIVGRQGYAFGTGGGDIHVMTANPWVTDVSVSPASAVLGTALTLDFVVDGDVDWDVRQGSETGAVLASGEATGSETIQVELTVDATYDEGVNDIIVVATDDAGRRGTRSAQVSVDNPPPAPALTDASVGFGNRQLTLNFGDAPVPDLATYEVYVSTTPFEPLDYETGGPPFDGTDALVTPVMVEVSASGETSATLSPLTNDVTYYIAARAIDAGGQESPMSPLVSGVPRPTFTASERNGDEGGPACSHVPLSMMVLPLALVGALTRRRRGVAAASAACALAVAAPARAELPQDETDAHWNVELRYGSVDLEDTGLTDTYGTNGHDIFEFEFGPQFYQFAELDIGIGYYRDKATATDEDGNPSGEETRFTMFPITLDVTLRGHILDEQPFVPFARIGLDYTLWREARVLEAGTDATRGSKAGWHWGLGGQLLLDTFARRRASRLEANTSINDTWLTVEYRRVYVDPGSFLFFDNSAGTSFSRSELMIGLKLDY